MLTETDQKRLADIRMHNAIASAHMDTSSWESTLFLRLHDAQVEEIKRLNGQK